MEHEEENFLSLNIALEIKIKYFLYINVNLWVLLSAVIMNLVSLLLMGMQNPTPKIGKTGAHQQRRGGIPWAENQAQRGNVQPQA